MNLIEVYDTKRGITRFMTKRALELSEPGRFNVIKSTEDGETSVTQSEPVEKKKEEEAVADADEAESTIDELRKEYETLSGGTADNRWKEKTLIKKIKALKE